MGGGGLELLVAWMDRAVTGSVTIVVWIEGVKL